MPVLEVFIGLTCLFLFADNVRLYWINDNLREKLDAAEEIEGQGFEQTTPDYDWYEDDVEYND